MKRTFEVMMSFARVGLAFLACIAFAFANAQAPQDAEIQAAQQLIYKDKKKAAIETLQKAITTYPEATNLYYYLGRAQLIAGDKAGAKASFDKGVEKNPKEPLNLVGQGRMLILDKNAAQAKIQFDKAIGLGKKNVPTFNAIAEAYLTDKTYQKDAMTIIERSIALNNTNPYTYLLKGDAHSFIMGQGGMAASAYERAYEIDAKYAAAWFKLGELYMNTNIAEAEKSYQQAVTVDPEFAEAHRELGELYYKKKDGVKAAKHYKAYLDLTDSPDKDDRFRYAFFLFMAKDYDNANKEFDPLSKKSDVTSTTLKFYAQSLNEAGNLAESERIFKEYMKHPQTKVDADDYNNLVKLLKKQGKDSLAMDAAEKSILLDNNQPSVLSDLIDYYFTKKKKYDQAERICRFAIKVRKTIVSTDYFTLGKSLFFRKKYIQADSAFAKFIELQPKITLSYTWAARSKSAQDSLLTEASAKPFYEKVIEIGSATPDKNKSDLIAAYQYMGSYHLTKNEFKPAKEYYEKALALGPEGKTKESIDEAIKFINNPPQQQKPKQKPRGK